MDNMITELLELHEKWGDSCLECGGSCDGYGDPLPDQWPCDTVEVIYKHYPELAKETE